MSDWGATVRETHSAVVLLMGEHAYKIKKPVDLGFLDFTTRASREHACHRELVLNRRMAADVYEGVADVLGPDGRPCEHVLVMRRMPDELRLSTLVDQGVDVTAALRHLARDLAAFHATARTNSEISACGAPDALRKRWLDNVGALRRLGVTLNTPVEPWMTDRIELLALRYLAGREPLLHSRMAARHVRDGHGDLLADDIFCLPDGPRTLDCLDFDDRLRWMDVVDDVASLAMDLERLGSPAAAMTLLRFYEEFSGDRQPRSLQHHYIAYRAVMRAKVAAIRAAERGGGDDESAETRRLCAIGLDHLEKAKVRLVLVGGSPASGKTTLAEALGAAMPAAVLSSDRARKELSGMSPKEHAPAAFQQGIYRPETTGETYAWLADHAHAMLAMGENVVVDASFAADVLRVPFRKASADSNADLVELCCRLPDAVREARLTSRAAFPDDLSDADLAVGRELHALADPWPEAVEVPTGGSGANAVRSALLSVEGAARSQSTRTESSHVDAGLESHRAQRRTDPSWGACRTSPPR
ncbi:AAA family ATPase [Terrabacter sp. MAHUQ-38]|uniref:bifunctional aminoglycoside phosphotransferase/ATP-binding protein n=1 Tax=unclassified Terrabacter TaxID=2630222 RepID=UPI00165DB38C|nr:AAA family ATPase [Terrabacter sp. MAHUQ-38]MBC9821189.1 AAA family ATPase [Terrabacter sp. MAHUQ-38]